MEIQEIIRSKFRSARTGWPGSDETIVGQTHNFLQNKLVNGVQVFIRSLAAQPATRLLCLLLALDSFFVLQHWLYLTDRVTNPAFALDWEQGYAEILQYAKLLGITLMLATLARRRRAPVYFHWALLFLYLLLDDALMIHESVGGLLVNHFQLPGLLGARPQDLGELLVYGFAGLVFLTTLTLTYQRSDRPARELSQYLVLLVVALGFFSVVLDLLQHMVRGRFLFQLLGTLEDAGEHLVISVIAWFLFVRVGRALEWEARAAGWVRLIVEGAALFLLFILLLNTIQFGAPGLAGNDGYYHAKFGLLVRQQGLKHTPPQLPLTILNEADFYDHHLLYHVYLAFFAIKDPVEDGGRALTHSVKVASVVMAALAFVAVWWLLRQQGVSWAWLWALGLLAVSEAFLYRMSMPRAQAASLLVLVLGLHWMLHGRYHLLLPLGFVYVWLYNAFPLLLVVAGTYFVATAVSERRLAWPALAYPAAGIVLGMLINPYFPQNFTFIGYHLGSKISLGDTRVGVEWYPYETWTLVENSAVALVAYWLGTLALGWRQERMDRRTLTLFLLAAVFGLMLFKSRRFIEYFPAFALIFTALSVSPLIAAWQQERPRLQRVLPVGFALLLAPLLFMTVREAGASVADARPADQYADASLWLREYSQPGSRVFQTDWDDFPRLYFYDSEKVYTVGLDPTYMELHDPDLFQTWVQITRGQVNTPGATIRERFGADYVFSDLEHDAFLAEAAKDPHLTEIYRDQYAVIFSVR